MVQKHRYRSGAFCDCSLKYLGCQKWQSPYICIIQYILSYYSNVFKVLWVNILSRQLNRINAHTCPQLKKSNKSHDMVISCEEVGLIQWTRMFYLKILAEFQSLTTASPMQNICHKSAIQPLSTGTFWLHKQYTDGQPHIR